MTNKLQLTGTMKLWLFWLFQFFFWNFLVLYFILFLLTPAQSNIYYALRIYLHFGFGFFITTSLRYYYLRNKSSWESKYFLAGSMIISSIILSNIWFLEALLIHKIFIHSGFDIFSSYLNGYFQNILIDFVILMAWSSLYLVYELWKDSVDKYKIELKIKELDEKRLKAELNTLKSQLNPQFLFSVLNSIYTNSLLKADITPEIVLKFSKLMSYILYDCKTERVPLQKEVEFIKNYIELKKIRLEGDIQVEFQSSHITNILVAPLLFVPLIENAFNYSAGKININRNIFISISLDNNRLSFLLENSKGQTDKSVRNIVSNGEGIKSMKKRLDYLHPKSYEIKMIENEEIFSIEVVIDNLKKL